MKKIRPLPPLSDLQSYFYFEAETGHFYRRSDYKRVGARCAGYILLWFNGTQYRAHRIGWSLHYGELLPPELEIDHINGDGMDNRIDNLRVATSMQNMWNQKESKRNSSGKSGVNFDKQTGKWRARIRTHGKVISLGRHDTYEMAAQARSVAEKEMKGEFAPISLR